MVSGHAFRAHYKSIVQGSRYSIAATLEEASALFNCLTFMSWVFFRIFHKEVEPLCEVADIGEEVALENITWGDLVFTAGRRGYYRSHKYGSIGHVGIVTEAGTIIHATRRKNVNGVIEESLEEFLSHHGPFRTARRLL